MPTAVSTFPSSTPAEKGNWHPRDPAAHKSCPRATSHFPVLGEDGAPRHPPTQHPGGGGGCTHFHPEDKGNAATLLGYREAAKRCWGGG